MNNQQIQELKQAVAKTKLFTNDEKVQILSTIDTYDDAAKEKLLRVIEECNSKLRLVVDEFGTAMKSDFDTFEKSASDQSVQVKGPTLKMKAGLDQVIDELKK